MPSTYCAEDDLLIPAGMASPTGEKARFVTQASEEMDSKLGYRYVVPIDLSETADPVLPLHQRLLLKDIAIKLASGRYIMSMTVHAPNEAMSAYALYLVREGEMNLMSIANGQIDLKAKEIGQDGSDVGAIDPPEKADPFARIPGVWNPDAVSAVTIFEKGFMTEDPRRLIWTPDENIEDVGRVDKVI